LTRGGIRNAAQLTNLRPGRTLRSWLFVVSVGLGAFLANWTWPIHGPAHIDDVIETGYLVVASIVLSSVDVRIERGRLNLSGIAIGAAALLLNPLHAALVGMSLGISLARRGAWPLVGNSLMAGSYASIGALIASHLRSQGDLTFQARVVVLILIFAGSWIFVTIGFTLSTGEPVLSIVKRNFTRQFYAAFGYFGLAALLTSYVIDGSLLGYALSTIVFVLALALTDTIAGRRIRSILENELSDADRHLFHSRAVEGVVHNLRNHIATAVGYLKEIDTQHLDPIDRDAVETAKAAANDAVTVLQGLSRGATPRVTYAPEPIDLNELVGRAMDMARPRARPKHIELALHETSEDVKVKADPLLLREVITNLVNNAIDAAPENGRVELSTGRRGGNSTFFSVADNGQGVADENRHHLFEPHFTTKEHGTGLGLFMSYGIVREHQGQLLYEGNRRGAVFTVVLPPFGG